MRLQRRHQPRRRPRRRRQRQVRAKAKRPRRVKSRDSHLCLRHHHPLVRHHPQHHQLPHQHQHHQACREVSRRVRPRLTTASMSLARTTMMIMVSMREATTRHVAIANNVPVQVEQERDCPRCARCPRLPSVDPHAIISSKDLQAQAPVLAAGANDDKRVKIPWLRLFEARKARMLRPRPRPRLHARRVIIREKTTRKRTRTSWRVQQLGFISVVPHENVVASTLTGWQAAVAVAVEKASEPDQRAILEVQVQARAVPARAAAAAAWV